MVISIPNEAELYAQQLALDCENTSIFKLIKQMQRFYTTEPFSEASLEIQIHPSLLSDGYRVNPCMLAKNANLGIFAYARGMYRDNTVIILFTNNSDDGISFNRKLKDHLLSSEDSISFLIEDVPESYRYKPELLRYRIKQTTGFRLITRKTKTHWIYRRAK